MVKVRVVEVEGDPEEVLSVSKLWRDASEHHNPPPLLPEVPEAAIGSSNGAPLTVDLVLRVLTRRELHSNVRKVLKALLRAGPKGMTSEELAKSVGIDRGQLAGVLGAFGRRMANTPGWPRGADLLQVLRDEKGRRHYHLPMVVRSALEKLEL